MSASVSRWSHIRGPRSLAKERGSRSFTRSRPPKHAIEASIGGGGLSNGATGLAGGGSAAAAAAPDSVAQAGSAAALACGNCAVSVPALRSAVQWPQKSELYILRSDGHSCTRETVQPSGNLQFACPSSQQQLLVWKTRPKRVMVLKKLGDELMEEYVDVLRYLGEELGMRVVVEPHDHPVLKGLCMNWVDTYEAEEVGSLHTFVDFVICLGGDGLLLHAAALFGNALPPIISFKLGSLGFLTTHNYVDYRRHLHDVVHGCRELASCEAVDALGGGPLRGVHITLRMRLQCEVWRGGQGPVESFEVLNEVVLSRGANPYLSKIEVFEAGRLITKVQADGVMLATPTGSTAYNVAAGGSMVHPSVPAILFTPICPHSLNFRPVILPDYAELELRIADDARCAAVVCFDGRESRELGRGDAIRVRMSPNPVPTINNADQTTDWFASIQRCFHWSERIEQLPISSVLLEGQPGSPAANGSSLASVGSAASMATSVDGL